jgi:hypothetical protein
MADNTVVNIAENSPEKIAYDLMQEVLKVEGYTLLPHVKDKKLADRETILSTYAECLLTVQMPGPRSKR